jgi:hypothetical protein
MLRYFAQQPLDGLQRVVGWHDDVHSTLLLSFEREAADDLVRASWPRVRENQRIGNDPGVNGARRLTGPRPTGEVPAPVVVDGHRQFQDKFARVGDEVFTSGQPTEQALRDLHAQGVMTVVNLRTPEEMSTRVSFDEAALVKNLGMEYVYVPVRGNAEFPVMKPRLRCVRTSRKWREPTNQ